MILDIDIIRITLYSMLPITELRASIPYFILLEEQFWVKVFICSIIGNISIGIIVRYIISPIMLLLRENRYFGIIINYIIDRTYTSSNRINRHKLIGLVLFIGIPLPFTGVWTGSLAAYLLSISKKNSILGIVIGVVVSATIVTAISLTGSNLLQFL